MDEWMDEVIGEEVGMGIIIAAIISISRLLYCLCKV